MSDVAIKVENLGKMYQIGEKQERYFTFRDTLTNIALAPFRRLRRIGKPPKKEEIIWALKDASFEIKHGEVIGIIGCNGAGKTTLLKILSRITEPTEGHAEIHGRVGSLLEVGTGFHPELTGRENIYLNGAILGMKKTEINQKFDEIVDFAEIEKFMDTPVKRYSSGMYVRLAFAVAAHLEPEILLVDEVLSVGDAAFQKKCLGKMGDVAKKGRTVLFVSHNMGAVGRLCHRGFLFDQGRLVFSGNMSDAIAQYTENVMESKAEFYCAPDMQKKIQIRAVRLLDHTGNPSTELDREYPFKVVIEYEVRRHIVGAHVTTNLDKVGEMLICGTQDIDMVPGGVIERQPGLYRSIVEFPGGLLNTGTYQIRIGIARYGDEVYDICEASVFHLYDYGSFAAASSRGQQRKGVLAIPLNWKTEKLE